MIGLPPICGICYGFYMKSDFLEQSNCHDMSSNMKGFTSKSIKNSKFLSPNEQINNTEYYNEMNYSRIQDGKKKQPDYIIVFRMNENEALEYLEEAQKASEQFGELSIVVVDIPKCLKAEKEKLDNLIERYNNGEKELAREIYYKIRNNRQTKESFAQKIDVSKYKEEFERQERLKRKKQ